MTEQRVLRTVLDNSAKGNTSPRQKVSKFAKTAADPRQHTDATIPGSISRRDRLAELNLKEEDLVKLEKSQQEGHIKTDLYEYQGEYVRHQGQTLKHGWGTLRFKTKSPSITSPIGHTLRLEEYTGQWWLDRRHGEGTYRFASGAVYRGQWENDLVHGFGQLLFPQPPLTSPSTSVSSASTTANSTASTLHRKRKTSAETPSHHRNASKSADDRDTDDGDDNEEHKSEQRSKDDTRHTANTSVTHRSAPYDLWSNGVVLRVANTLFFAHTDPHTNSKQQQLRELKGLYVIPPRLELLKEWETLWKFAERPPEGLYTCEYLLKVQEGLVADPTLRAKLLDFCVRWYRDLSQCELIVLVPDLERGYFLTVDQAVTKSAIPRHLVALFVRRQGVTEAELLKLFDIALCGDKKHHQQLVAHLKTIACPPDNWDFSLRVGDVVMTYALPVGPELNFTHAALREAERRANERRDAQKPLGASLAVALLRLYRLRVVHLPTSEHVQTLQTAKRHQLSDVSDADEKRLLSELHERLMHIFVEYNVELLWRIHHALRLLQTETYPKATRAVLSRLAKGILLHTHSALSVLRTLAQSLPHNQVLLDKIAQLGGDNAPSTFSLEATLQRVWDIITGHDIPRATSTASSSSSLTMASATTSSTSEQSSTVEGILSVRPHRKSILEGVRITHPLTRPSRIGLSSLITADATKSTFKDPHISESAETEANKKDEKESSESASLRPEEVRVPLSAQVASPSNGAFIPAHTATDDNYNSHDKSCGTIATKEKKHKVKKVNASTSRKVHVKDEEHYFQAGCVVSLNDDIQRRIIDSQLHLVPPLARSGQPQLEEWAVTCLESEWLLIDSFRRDEMQSQELCSMLLDLVCHNIPDRIKAAALYVLSKFADDDTDTIKQRLVDHGVERIFELLKMHTPDFVQRDACELIAVLASGSEEIRESIVERFKALDILVKKLSNKRADDLRCAAARALTNLCYNDKYKEDICSKGVLPALLEFARQGKLQISKEIKQSQIQKGRPLGSGAFAKVFEGRYKGKPVAIKVFRESSFAFRLEDFYREVAIMSMISHPHVVRFEGACIEHKRDEEGVFMIVTELMQKGSLRELIDKTYHGPLPIDKTLRYATHVALGMRYLHRFDVIHRDLKADNVLVNQDDVAKVADLGLSREINIDDGMTIMAGTPKWEAPEVLASSKRKGDTSKTSRYSKEADVYSYGMTLYEMISGMQPFAEIHDIFELKKAVCDKHKRPKLPPSCPAPLANLIKLCWHKDPAKRPSFDSILVTLEDIHKQLNIPFSAFTPIAPSSNSTSSSTMAAVSPLSSPGLKK
jgi:hypothetical protein